MSNNSFGEIKAGQGEPTVINISNGKAGQGAGTYRPIITFIPNVSSSVKFFANSIEELLSNVYFERYKNQSNSHFSYLANSEWMDELRKLDEDNVLMFQSDEYPNGIELGYVLGIDLYHTYLPPFK